MSLYDKFEMDTDAETGEGVPLVYDFGEDTPPAKIWVRAAGRRNKGWRDRYVALMKPHQHTLDKGGKIDDETMDEINRRLTAEKIIVRWENVTDRAGNQIEFNVENAMSLLKDLPVLHEDIQGFALNRDNFLLSVTQSSSGN